MLDSAHGKKRQSTSLHAEQNSRRQRGQLRHNPFGDGWVEHIFCARLGISSSPETSNPSAQNRNARTKIVLPPEEDVEEEGWEEEGWGELFNFQEDGTLAVKRWASKVPLGAFKEGQLEEDSITSLDREGSSEPSSSSIIDFKRR